MKLVSYELHDRTSWGLVIGEEIADLRAVLGKRYSDLRSLIAAQAYVEAAAAVTRAPRVPLATVRLLPVIPNPEKILCIGLNYETHRKETQRPEAEHPTIFIRFADSQIGHNAPILRPHVSTQLDYEGELAVVIGKGGRYIPRSEAMNHVAGYACYNDATLRDWQRHTHQFTPGKNFPGTGAFGPWLITRDEITDVGALQLQTRLNGEVMQTTSISQMIFPIEVLIEYCSAFTPLSPGDVIATGTPGGVGFKREPQRFMKPGDVVEVEITQLGTLSNTIADE